MSHIRNRSQAIVILVLSVGVFLGTFAIVSSTGKQAEAHDIGWEWDYPNVSITVEGRQTFPWNSELCTSSISAKNEINDTALNIANCEYHNYSGNHNSGDVIHYYGNYGVQSWLAFASAFNNANPCASYPSGVVIPGNCNSVDKKTNFAYIYWNTNSHTFTFAEAYYVSKHEMGHVFGFRHPHCNSSDSDYAWSVMLDANDSRCGGGVTVPGNLTPHDDDDYDNKYN